MIITKEDMKQFGGVIVRLFESMYPNGTTLEQMKIDAPNHRWIRVVLEQWGENA